MSETSTQKFKDNIEQHREELIDKLIAMKEKYNSLAKLENMSGISKGTLSNISNRVDLHKVSQAMWNKLEALVVTKAERTGWKLTVTKNTQLIYATCDAAATERTMKMIIGETGFGKTTALENYARTNHQTTVYVLMDPSMGIRDCLIAIAAAYNMPIEGTQHVLSNAIAKRMKEHGGLLILDDCGKVIQKFFRLLQVIYDKSEGMCGIVLAGVPSLKEHLKKGARKMKESYPELVSRISYTQSLHPPTSTVITNLCNKHGITDEGAIKYVIQVSKNFRDVRNLIETANRLKSEGITREDLAQVNVGGFYDRD